MDSPLSETRNPTPETRTQVEKYNEQMKGEIAITRRATYKAEEQVGLLEVEKKHQDLLIEDLMRYYTRNPKP